MCGDVSVRAYQPADTVRLVDIFVHAILSIETSIYSHQQKLAWSAVDEHLCDNNDDKWLQRFAKTQPLLAVDKNNKAIGFIEFLAQQNHLGEHAIAQGYIDCLYIHPDYQRQGVAQKLYQQGVVKPAKNMAIDKIWVYASLVAQPFFSKQGFVCISRHTVIRRGVELENWLMQNTLE